MEWDSGHLDKVTLHSKVDQKVSIIYMDKVYSLELKSGVPMVNSF